MGKRMTIPSVFGLTLIVGLLAGCAGRGLIISSPPWYAMESGVYHMEGARVFYGIGQAGGVQNQALLRATADNRARKELAGVLENYVGELARSAMPSSDPNWAALSLEERQQVLGMLVRNALQRSMVSEHWNDGHKSRLLSLCRLDLATFKQALSNTSALDERTRSAMAAEAEQVHARLSQKGN